MRSPAKDRRALTGSVPPSMAAMATAELELAQSQLEAALRAWDSRVTQAHELLRKALDTADATGRG